MEFTFTNIYDKGIWGGGSGRGSGHKYNKKLIAFLEHFILTNSIKNVLDIGCGEWEFSRFIDWKCDYEGIDCVKSVVDGNRINFETDRITFNHVDIFSDRSVLNKYHDLIILKDILQHWTNDNIINFMDELYNSNNYKYILLINSNNRNNEIIERDINNYYKYAKLDYNKYPLNQYQPQLIFSYQYKQVSLITK
tara:strand:+ start:1272 stop:1853 length:582 start_codon:yes stop_codon:yes gene_type:complete